MRVLCSFPNPFPFKNMAVRQRIIYLLSKNYQLVFITRKFVEVPEELYQNNATIIKCPYHFKNNYIDIFFYLFWSFFRIYKFKCQEFCISYSFHEPSSVLIGFFAKFFKKAKFWIIDFLDDPGLEFKNWCRRNMSIKKIIILTILGTLRVLNKVILKKSNLQIVQGMSKEDRLPLLLSKEYKISFDTMITVPNGIDLQLIKPKQKDKKDDNKFKVFYVGYVSELRGIGTIIDALSLLKTKIPNILLILVGPSKENDKIWLKNKLIATNMIENVKYLGVLESEKVWELIEDSNVCIYPFQNEELAYVFPVKIFEYLALNKLVIASNLEGVSHIIKNRYNGLLVNPTDPKDWANAIYEIYKNSSLKSKLIKNARKSIEKFDWNIINNKIDNELQKFVQKC